MTRTHPATATISLIEGRATLEGTKRVRKRFARAYADNFYRELPHGPLVSSLGLGTYLGECDESEDARYTATAGAALEKGVNLVDTAINYRCQRSERAIGEALRSAITSRTIKREEVVVCTKGGYIPLDGMPPSTKEEYRGFLDTEYFERGVMQPADVVGGGHCLTPRYIEDQIERSRNNLGLEVIDVYYLHNPEQQLEVLDRSAFLDVVRAAFAELERQVKRGVIGIYGCATWNGFRVSADAKNHLSLEELVAIGHRFAYSLDEEPPERRALYPPGSTRVEVECFVASVAPGWEPVLDFEHDDHRWCAREEARELFFWDDVKDALARVDWGG